MRKRNVIVLLSSLVLLLPLLFGRYWLANHKTVQARDLYNNAVSLLNRTGGIASFYTLPGAPHLLGPMANPIPLEELSKTLEEVISDLRRVIELDPGIKGASYFLGVAYLKKMDRGEAIKAFYKAIDVEPDREMSYILLCYILWDAKEYKEALNVTSRYATQCPHSEITSAMLAGKTHLLMGDYHKALKYALGIIQTDSSRWEGRALAASSYYCLGDLQAAAEQFKALEADPRTSKDVDLFKNDLKEKCGEVQGHGR